MYFLTRKRRAADPGAADDAEPRQHDRLARAARTLARRAGGGGRRDDPARDAPATKLLVTHGRVRGVRTGDRGRGRDGEQLANFEAGPDVVAQVTVLAEGTQGHLTARRSTASGSQGENPQVWALGVKEVWKVARPLDRVIHTMGWPLRGAAKYREFGGSFVYPMGEDMVSLGIVVGLEYRDVELSVHDLLQEFKTHPKILKILEGGERIAWGAKTITEGGCCRCPRGSTRRGSSSSAKAAGLVNVPALKGIHYAVESGMLAAEATSRRCSRARRRRPGALERYDEALRRASSGRTWPGPQHAPGLRARLLPGRCARERDDVSRAIFPPRD